MNDIGGDVSDDKNESEKLFDPRDVLVVNASPLQLPGRDRLLKTVTVAGPDMPGDRRVFLSASLLERCLDVARSSSMQRCTLDKAGIRVDLYEDRSGHRYEVWTLIGIGPKPEQLPSVLGGPARG